MALPNDSNTESPDEGADDLATLVIANPAGVQSPAQTQAAHGGASVMGANPAAPVPLVFGRRIAQGGMGAILEADDCKLGRKIAVKMMLLKRDADEEHKQRFIQEAAVLAKLAHPNIIPIYDLGHDDEGQLYYSMKLVKGVTLQDILNDLREEKPEALAHYTLDRLLTIFRKVCDALAFAHAQKIIHRDLKPENIMVGEFGEVLVMDWGLAKTIDTAARPKVAAVAAVPPPAQDIDLSLQETVAACNVEQSSGALGMTLEGAVMGTPQYMSPEQAEGRVGDMDSRSDIFSLGGILYAILTLRPPVEGQTLGEVLQKVANGSITAPSSLGSITGKGTPNSRDEVLEAKKIRPLPHCPGGRVPAAVSAVVMKALAVQRDKRYQTVAALSTDVEAYQGGFATTAEQAGAWKLGALFVRRNKAASMGVAAVMLVGASFGTKAVIEGRRAERSLASLKKTAPTMLALAQSEAVAQHLESALAKTDAALSLDPGLLTAYWRRAWNLVALGRFSDAAAALRSASEHDPAHARQFGIVLPQIEKIAAAPSEAERYAPDLLTPVFEFLSAHDALGEAGALIQHLRLTNDRRIAIARERLKALGGSVAGVGQNPAGLIELNPGVAGLRSLEQVRGIPCDILYARNANIESLEPLRGLRLSRLDLDANHISDLAPLRGMALVELNLSYCGPAFSDLSPLAGMPLRTLRLMGCQRVVDIAPLRGMPLEDLALDGTHVSDLRPLVGAPLHRLNAGAAYDLRPLAGMPLEYLALPGSSIVIDLSPLVGLPLKELYIRHVKFKDLTPLLRIPTLELLTLTDETPSNLLAPLRQHPKLTSIDYLGKGYRPAADVWAELDAKQAAGEK